MAVSPRTSFRRAAFAAAFLGASALASFPAAAQTVSASGGSPACAPVKDAIRGIKCEINESVRRTDAANTRADAAAVVKACSDYLLKGIADKKWTQPQLLAEAPGGKFTPDNVCGVAMKHGYDRRASVDPQ
jgi:hypothetical protein